MMHQCIVESATTTRESINSKMIKACGGARTSSGVNDCGESLD